LPANINSLPKNVSSFIEQYGLLSGGEKVLVAVSGGPDSVCLLYFLNSLIDCNNPAFLKTLAEKSQNEITQFYKEDPGELRQNRYVLYKLRIVLSISLPPGLEFGARDNFTWTTKSGQEVKTTQRSTEVIVSTDAVTIDYENSHIVISLQQWAGLNLIQKAREEGVELLLSTNVSNLWNIEPS